MFKVVPFFQKHFRKCSITAYIHQQSLLPNGLLSQSSRSSASTNEVEDEDLSKIVAPTKSCNSDIPEPSSLQCPCPSQKAHDRFMEKLKTMRKIVLNKTRTVRKTVGFLHDSGIVVREFELLDERGEKVFDVEIQQGDLIEEFGIKLFDASSDTLFCVMALKSNMELKGLVLEIEAPPKQLIGCVYEMKGMSKITFVRDNQELLVYQVFTNRGLGGFGWTTSAKILTPEGNEKLGDLQITKQQQGLDSLSMAINLPPTPQGQVLNKVLALGACLILVKDY